MLLLGDHVYISEVKDRCVLQLIRTFEKFGLDALTGVQPTIGEAAAPVRHDQGPALRRGPRHLRGRAHHREARRPRPPATRLVTPGPARRELPDPTSASTSSAPGIFDSIQHLIDNGIRDKNEYQFTTAQEHLRASGAKYWTQIVQGQRYDTGIPYGLMETQLALALHGRSRAEICEAIARILAMQVKE